MGNSVREKTLAISHRGRALTLQGEVRVGEVLSRGAEAAGGRLRGAVPARLDADPHEGAGHRAAERPGAVARLPHRTPPGGDDEAAGGEERGCHPRGDSLYCPRRSFDICFYTLAPFPRASEIPLFTDSESEYCFPKFHDKKAHGTKNNPTKKPLVTLAPSRYRSPCAYVGL